MKKILALALSLVVAFAFAGMVFAQTSTPAKTEAQTKAAPAAKEVHKHLTGKVVSVDALANTLTVKGKKGEETFQVDPAAKITIGKQEVKLADVKKDTKVTVVYKVQDGKKVATSIK